VLMSATHPMGSDGTRASSEAVRPGFWIESATEESGESMDSGDAIARD